LIDTQNNVLDRISDKQTVATNNLTHSNPELFKFIENIIGMNDAGRLLCTLSNNHLNIASLTEHSSGYAILCRLNNIRRINKFLEKMNQNMAPGQHILVKMETKRTRSNRLLNRYPKIIGYPVFALDFLLNRVIPKLSVTKKVYFFLTKGKGRVMSLSEGLARMFSCGFEVLDYIKIGDDTYILAKKVRQPAYDKTPTYGLLVKLERIGQNGEFISVHKIRTMHPYSEYLQEYLFEHHGTKDGDKIEKDFRVTRWGRFMRKYWIDELPMLWNWIKRDLKLIGVRPLSEHKFNTYPEYLQKKRIRYKPGMIPPYYADLPQTVEDFFEAEEKYLNAYDKNPIRTDLKYFFKSLNNILIKGERSR